MKKIYLKLSTLFSRLSWYFLQKATTDYIVGIAKRDLEKGELVDINDVII